MSDEISSRGNPNWKPTYLSEYSMGQYDFERYNFWVKEIEKWSAEINTTADPQLHQIQNLFAALITLYRNWHPIIASKTITDKLDLKIKEVKEKKRILENNEQIGSPYNKALVIKITDLLEEITMEIMDIKQKLGYGTQVRKNLSTKEKIRAGITGSFKKNRFENLPEA